MIEVEPADDIPANESRAGVFATTRWSLVLDATEPDAAESASTAFARLPNSPAHGRTPEFKFRICHK